MAHLIIKNIGPIKNVEFDLNKINIFMGPQSSGKSTIAKIISFCLWIEKDVCIFRDYIDKIANFRKLLEEYNNLQGYISAQSYIKYVSAYISIEYTGNSMGNIYPTDEIERLTYKRAKIIYIPAERNLIAIPNWTSLKLPENNLKNFVTEWGFTREIFNKELPLSISPLHITYYYDQQNYTDYVTLPDQKGKIAITSASSGIQSSIPLYLLQKAYCKYQQKLNENNSFEDVVTLDKVYRCLKFPKTNENNSFEDVVTLDKVYRYLHFPTTRAYPNSIPKSDFFHYKGRYCVVEPGMKEKAIEILNNYTEIQIVQSIIEEPESNLFPQTQQGLTYELVADSIGNDNQLIITTHSPYILFALNNCMMGGLVGNNIPEEERSNYPSYSAWIDPNKVSVYEIHNGEIRRIQDKDGILEDNYLNQAYKENSSEYLSLLNYYEDEE